MRANAQVNLFQGRSRAKTPSGRRNPRVHSLSTSQAEPIGPIPSQGGWDSLRTMTNETSSVGFRLRSMAGHLDGVIRMVEEHRDCVEVLYQLSAVQGAVETVRHQILESHLRRCVPESLSKAGVSAIVDDLLSASFGSAAPAVREIRRCHLAAGPRSGSPA